MNIVTSGNTIAADANTARDIIVALVSDEDAGIASYEYGRECTYCDAGEFDVVLHKPDCPILAGRKWLAEQEAANE